MLEKMKNKALSLNLKKSFLLLVIVGVLFGVGSGIALYLNFGDRITQAAEYERQQREEWLQDFEQDRQEAGEQSQVPEWGWRGHDGYYGNWGHQSGDLKNWRYGFRDNGWEQSWDLSTGDRVLIGVLFGVGALLGIAYWLLCMAWAYQKASKMGSNGRLWTIATLFFNLWAIAALYVYSFVRGTCKNCGRLKKADENYCSQCGAAYHQECSHCHAPVQKGSNFCPNCGAAINGDTSL